MKGGNVNMAIYHCSCKIISRSNGRSSVGASAYRSGENLVNEYDGLRHDYTHKQGIVHTEIIIPNNAPIEFKDRKTLWNEVERIEKSQNGQLAREIEIALPKELTRKQQIECVRSFANNNLVSEGMCVDIAIHDKKDGNPHAHIMCTMRPINSKGQWENKAEKLYLCKNADGEERAFTSKELSSQKAGVWEKQYHYSKGGKKNVKKLYLTEREVETNPKYKDYARIKNDKYPKSEKFGRRNPSIERWNSKEFLQNIRAGLSNEINKSLEKHGHSERVDHRSYQEQGIDLIPTIHLGKTAHKMEMDGKESDRGNINRSIISQNASIHKINKELKAIKMELVQVQTDIQIQNTHNNLQLAYSSIDNSNEKQIRAIEKNVQNMREKFQSIYENNKLMKDVWIRLHDKTSVRYMEYHKEKIEKECKAILDKCNNRLEKLKEHIKEKPTPKEMNVQNVAIELEHIRKEYIKVTAELNASEKITNQPRVTREYEVAYNKIQTCLTEIDKNTSIHDNAKAERDKLGAFKGKEKKALDITIKKASENIHRQLDVLKKLGVSELSKAQSRLQELKAQDDKEKQVIKSFAISKAELKNRAEELGNRYIEIKANLSSKEQERVTELQEKIRDSQPVQEKSLRSIEQVMAEVKAKDLEPQAVEQKREKERIKTRTQGRGWGD